MLAEILGPLGLLEWREGSNTGRLLVGVLELEEAGAARPQEQGRL